MVDQHITPAGHESQFDAGLSLPSRLSLSLKLSVEPITTKNLAEAIEIGDCCFADSIDRQELRKTYVEWCARGEQEIQSTDPFFESIGRLVSYQLYRNSEGAAVGVGGVYQLKDDAQSRWLGWLGVNPEFRNQGIGAAIVLDCEERARCSGGERMKVYHVIGDEKIDSFYQNLGYRYLHDVEIGDGPKSVREKSLL